MSLFGLGPNFSSNFKHLLSCSVITKISFHQKEKERKKERTKISYQYKNYGVQMIIVQSNLLTMASNVFFFFVLLKVPSFPDDIAMALIQEELGQPWQNIYSELSSSPIAAGSSQDNQLDIIDSCKVY